MSARPPAVSVVIPAYRAAALLPATLASVREQTWTDWELVVVEDGSDDGTRQLVTAFARTVPNAVHYHRHPVNRGLSATRNSGMAVAQAAWVALVDADDLWLPHHLADLVETAQRTGARMVGAGCQIFDHDTGRDLAERIPTPAAAANPAVGIFTGAWILQPSAVMIQRAAALSLGGGFRVNQFVEDREFWLRWLASGQTIAYTGRISCRYRKHAHALSRRVTEMAIAQAEITERYVDWPALPPGLGRREAAAVWLAAGRLQRRANPAAARDCFRRASHWRPLWWRPWVYRLGTPGGTPGAKVVSPPTGGDGAG